VIKRHIINYEYYIIHTGLGGAYHGRSITVT